MKIHRGNGLITWKRGAVCLLVPVNGIKTLVNNFEYMNCTRSLAFPRNLRIYSIVECRKKKKNPTNQPTNQKKLDKCSGIELPELSLSKLFILLGKVA
jgi:hypothetical protein